jgi:hypothetical protein
MADAKSKAKDGQKLARQRVMLRMKEKSRAKEEENNAREKQRAERADREKLRVEQKVQQRAEIYALNAIMRGWNVRQRALYLKQQKQLLAGGTDATAAVAAVEGKVDQDATKLAEAMQDRSVLSV